MRFLDPYREGSGKFVLSRQQTLMVLDGYNSETERGH